jgi:hypothetical protein
LNTAQLFFHKRARQGVRLHLDAGVCLLTAKASDPLNLFGHAFHEQGLLGLPVRIEGFLVNVNGPTGAAVVFARRPSARKTRQITGLNRLNCFSQVNDAHVAPLK